MEAERSSRSPRGAAREAQASLRRELAAERGALTAAHAAELVQLKAELESSARALRAERERAETCERVRDAARADTAKMARELESARQARADAEQRASNADLHLRESSAALAKAQNQTARDVKRLETLAAQLARARELRTRVPEPAPDVVREHPAPRGDDKQLASLRAALAKAEARALHAEEAKRALIVRADRADRASEPAVRPDSAPPERPGARSAEAAALQRRLDATSSELDAARRQLARHRSEAGSALAGAKADAEARETELRLRLADARRADRLSAERGRNAVSLAEAQAKRQLLALGAERERAERLAKAALSARTGGLALRDAALLFQGPAAEAGVQPPPLQTRAQSEAGAQQPPLQTRAQSAGSAPRARARGSNGGPGLSQTGPDSDEEPPPPPPPPGSPPLSRAKPTHPPPPPRVPPRAIAALVAEVDDLRAQLGAAKLDYARGLRARDEAIAGLRRSAEASERLHARSLAATEARLTQALEGAEARAELAQKRERSAKATSAEARAAASRERVEAQHAREVAQLQAVQALHGKAVVR